MSNLLEGHTAHIGAHFLGGFSETNSKIIGKNFVHGHLLEYPADCL
jgi:hypothetical protein